MSLINVSLSDGRGHMTGLATDECTAFIGRDWADAKHDICLQAAGSDQREGQVLEHRPEVIAAWTTALLQRFAGGPIAIALDLTKGPLVEALRTYDGLVLFHIHPMMLARYREAFTPSRAKDEPTDAELQLELFLQHRDKRTPLVPQSPEMRALAHVVDHRRRLGGDRIRMTHRLTRTLKTYCPHVLEWCPTQETRLCGDFLSQWPTLQAAQLARRRTLERFFPQHQVRGAQRIRERLEAIKSAVPLTTAEAVVRPHALMAQSLMRQWRVIFEAMARFDQAIAERPQRHPAFALFDALPGAGPI
jgi:hypothetical protein